MGGSCSMGTTYTFHIGSPDYYLYCEDGSGYSYRTNYCCIPWYAEWYTWTVLAVMIIVALVVGVIIVKKRQQQQSFQQQVYSQENTGSGYNNGYAQPY